MTTMKQLRMEYLKQALLELTLAAIVIGMFTTVITQLTIGTAHADPVLPECTKCGCVTAQKNVIISAEAI